jgi:hypothetical protein
MAIALHNAIERYNILKAPTDQINNYLNHHLVFRKTALLVNHIFRTVSILAFQNLFPSSAPINLAMCFSGSLFYRLTVETHCAYKYALPAFGGAISFLIGKQAISHVIHGVAFTSLSTLASTLSALTPLACYVSYILLTVSYDVDASI